jgi:16S rRNA (uracil1498-N3)-methyltransferase
MPRIYCSTRLGQHTALDLPSDAAKHCQVLRLQPLDALTLFDGFGGEYQAHIVEMGRQTVHVRVQDFDPIERDNKHQVHLIIGMPANDRMDWLVEKATELGVHRITPVMTSRSVLRLSGERAQKKQLHWRGIALAACAQSARNSIPLIDAPVALDTWCSSGVQAEVPTQPIQEGSELPVVKKMLSTRLLQGATERDIMHTGLASALVSPHRIQVVSGPEGGLSQDEELALRDLGFEPCSLGPRVLRAETAALVALTLLGNA